MDVEVNAQHVVDGGQTWTITLGNARSEAELAYIWCLSVTYLQTGAAQNHHIETHIQAHIHTPTHQHTNTFRTEDEMTEVQSLMIYEQLQMYINFNPFRVQEYLNFIYIYIYTHIYVFTYTYDTYILLMVCFV